MIVTRWTLPLSGRARCTRCSGCGPRRRPLADARRIRPGHVRDMSETCPAGAPRGCGPRALVDRGRRGQEPEITRDQPRSSEITRDHSRSPERPSSAAPLVLASLVLTRCSEHTACRWRRLPALRAASLVAGEGRDERRRGLAAASAAWAGDGGDPLAAAGWPADTLEDPSRTRPRHVRDMSCRPADTLEAAIGRLSWVRRHLPPPEGVETRGDMCCACARTCTCTCTCTCGDRCMHMHMHMWR